MLRSSDDYFNLKHSNPPLESRTRPPSPRASSPTLALSLKGRAGMCRNMGWGTVERIGWLSLPGFHPYPSLKIPLEGYEQNVFDLEAKCLSFTDYFIHALIQ